MVKHQLLLIQEVKKMNDKQKQFFNDLKTVLQEHGASVAFSGNQLTWYVDGESFNEPGIVTNAKSVDEMVENHN